MNLACSCPLPSYPLQVGLLAIATAVACGDLDDASVTEQSDALFGEASTVSVDTPVVALFRPSVTNRPSCSGSLVGANAVVTADHCFDRERTGITVRVPGGRPRNGNTWRYKHDVRWIRQTHSADLAVVCTRTSIDYRLPRYTSIASNAEGVFGRGGSFRVYGFGARSQNSSDNDGFLRTGELYDPEPRSSGSNDLLFPAEDQDVLAGSGDSGGPVLRGSRLVGVTVQSVGTGLRGTIATNIATWRSRLMDDIRACDQTTEFTVESDYGSTVTARCGSQSCSASGTRGACTVTCPQPSTVQFTCSVNSGRRIHENNVYQGDSFLYEDRNCRSGSSCASSVSTRVADRFECDSERRD